MEKHIEWWNNLLPYTKKKYAEDYQWTTVDKISDYQIELIYNETQNY